jgi:hypothetical protein
MCSFSYSDKVTNTFYKQGTTHNIMFKVVLFLATIHKASKSTEISTIQNKNTNYVLIFHTTLNAQEETS